MKKFFIALAVVSLLLNVANAAPHKYRVRDSATAAALLARGGKVIADYGGFQMIEVDLPALTDAGKGAELEDESDVIELHAAHLNTRDTKVKAQRKTLGNFPGKRLHLVQFAGPVKPEWREALEKTGVRIVTYIPNNAYLIYGDTASLAKLQSWAGAEATVQWEGDYADDYKINPHARLTNDLGQAQMPAIATFAIQLVDDAAANTNTLAIIDGLKQSSVQRQTRSLGYLDVIVELPTGQLGDLAAQPDVVSIQPYQTRHKLDERQDQIVAGNLIGNLPSGPGYLAWLASKGFTQAQFNASGFLVDVSDSGIDNGTTSPGHFGLYQSGIPAQGSRVVYNRLEGTANSGSTLSGCDGHGNLNTHIIAGYDNFTNFPHTDSTGYRYGLGVCPFVKVGSSVIFDPNNFTSPNYPNLQSRAYNNGARVSANSWGGSTAGAYDVDAQSYDALVRDAQPSGAAVPNTGNQQMVIVFAAGNDGPSVQTVGSPGTAKNVIVVGAAENVRSHSTANGGNNAAGNDGCTTPDTEADSANDMATFSSRGPCSDGRVKPDIIAPGTHITGGVGQSGSATTNGTGVALACFTGAGVCGLPGGGTAGNTNNFFPLGQQFYSTSSGTSHSTPAVAGGCALLRQYFINNSLTPPSPAMTKAFLMNSARYLTGDSANDTLPSDNQGMGEMNLGTAFDGAVRILHDQLTADKFTASGQVRIIAGLVADGSKPFRVTVAWTDAPGNTTGNAYNNDLDLTVTIGGQTYKGNVFSGANSVTGGSADKKNNVESIFIPAGVTGPFTVTVTAANINSDGVPNEAPATDQDYALVIYNGVETSTPVVNLTAFNLTAENCGTANGVIDPGETVTVNVALQNTGTANTTNLIVTLLATNGVTLPSAAKVYGALNTNGAVVTQAFSFTATGSCGGSLTATFALQDGTNALASINYPVTLGQLATVWSQNFDGVTKPALPAGWTTAAGGGLSAWKTTNSLSDTSPNSAFTACAATVGSNELDSAVIALPSGSSQLTFRHHYDLEASSSSATGYDGGVLEIKIGAGAYADILAAGGSFVSGGYSYTISSSYNNPFSGRQAWSGTNIGFTTVVVNLPAAAAGQNIQLRWRSGSDSSTAKTGWWVDSAAISSYVCCSGGYAPIITTNPASLTISADNAATFSVAATGTAPLAYQWRFNNINILGAVTNFYNLASAQITNAGNYAVVITNFSGSVTSTPAVLTVTSNVIAAVPVISAATYTNHQFSFIINGSVGSNYIIQASTNLAANNWITLATNVAPFLFIESNMNLFLQRFYRSGIAP